MLLFWTALLPGDVGITLRVLDIVIPGANYEDGPAQGLDELDTQGIST
jgi:hypothetical protein